jgi:hypothetical protein
MTMSTTEPTTNPTTAPAADDSPVALTEVAAAKVPKKKGSKDKASACK